MPKGVARSCVVDIKVSESCHQFDAKYASLVDYSIIVSDIKFYELYILLVILSFEEIQG